MVTFDPDMTIEEAEMAPEHYQLFFGQMIHSLGAYLLMSVGSFLVLGSATRLGLNHSFVPPKLSIHPCLPRSAIFLDLCSQWLVMDNAGRMGAPNELL